VKVLYDIIFKEEKSKLQNAFILSCKPYTFYLQAENGAK